MTSAPTYLSERSAPAYDEDPPMFGGHSISLDSVAEDWWVAQVKSRMDKLFAWAMNLRGIDYYIPLRQSETCSGGKRRVCQVPVFPGYVFFAGDEHVPAIAYETLRVCSVLPVKNQAAVRRELRMIDNAIAANPHLEVAEFAVKGNRVRVTSGALRGFEGTVIDRPKSSLVILDVTTLGRSVVVELPPSILEPVD